MMVYLRVAAFCAFIALLSGAVAGFNPGASDNLAVYWGQNSINRADDGQQRLATYCANTPVNIIPIAFLTAIKNPTSVNFANAGDNCTTFPGTQLLNCPQIEEDIQTCQSLNKTILLSLGGATYTEGGFASPDEATTWAAKVWAMFGPPGPAAASPVSDPCACSDSDSTSSEEEEVLRPFGLASVDGFDMDFEASSANMAPFAGALRGHMDAATAATGRRFLLSAAPQCPFPDVAMREMLEQVGFDFVSVQFYNNYCGAGSYPGNFNFDRWDRWAREESVKKGVKVLVGLPGSPTAAGSGYVSGEQLEAVVQHSKGFESFGGVMVWDISQIYGNPGFLDSLVLALGGDLPGTTSTLTTTSTITTTSTRTKTTSPTTTQTPTPVSTTSFVTRTTTTAITPSPTSSLVPHWGQCGGRDWTGSTQCETPYKCVAVGEWWSHCA